MAFYAYDATHEAVQAINGGEPLRRDGVGAYYAYDATHEAVQPINGLALGAAASLSDEALRAIVGNRKPLAVVSEWATRLTDTAWRPPSSTDELSLLPVTDADLKAAKKGAFGHDLPMIAVVSRSPALLERARGVFVGTPYVFSEELAVYGVSDARPAPVPLFLFTATVREPDDRDGGSAGLQKTAAMLSGNLVYPVALPATTRRRLLPPIQMALSHLPAPPARRAPGAPPPPPTPSVIGPGGAQRQQGFEVGALRGIADVLNSTSFQLGLVALVGVGLVGAGIVAASKASD